MLVALFGPTGVGKSYLVSKLVEDGGFEAVRTIRTRKMRPSEVNIKEAVFMSSDELDNLVREGKIAHHFEAFGGRYGYLKEDIFTDRKMIFEMHYEQIDTWKKIAPHMKMIYIMPNDKSVPFDMTKERNLSPEKEKERLDDIKHQYDMIENDLTFRQKFDKILINDYTDKFVSNLISELSNLEA